MRPKLVLFDAVGTLIEPQPNSVVVYHQVAEHLGLNASQEQIASRFGPAFGRQESLDEKTHGWITSESREADRWQEIIRDVFEEASDTKPLFDALWEHFAQPQSWSVFEDAEPAFAALRQRDIRWGIASNFDTRLRKIVNQSEELTDCWEVFISSEIGWRKPSEGFFRHIQAVSRLSQNELLLVGDHIKNDYQGATQAGWNCLIVDRSGRYPDLPTMSSLAQLSEFLD